MLRLSILFAVLILALAGCAGGSDSASEEPPEIAPPTSTLAEDFPTETEAAPTEAGRVYTKADLPRLALQASDAPQGMRYTKVESGARTFEEAGLVVETQLEEVRAFGLNGIYDVTFDSTQSDLRLSSRLWVFGQAGGAERWLEKSEADTAQFALEPLPAPPLGNASWAAQGDLAGTQVVSYAFQQENVVVVVTLSGQVAVPSEGEALAAAQQAFDRFDRVT